MTPLLEKLAIPRVFAEALLLGVAGSMLALACDLSLEGGVLRDLQAVHSELSLLVPVHVVGARELAHGLQSGAWVALDARTRREFDRGHVKGAVSLPAELLDRPDSADAVERILEPLRDKKVAVLLPAERLEDARQFAQTLLRDHGFQYAASLRGGLESWSEQDSPWR